MLPALAVAGQAPPAIGPPADVGAVPNGDLVAGLEGWGSIGPGLSLVGGPIIQASDNTTVLTPPVAIPPTAQALPVSMGVPGANALVEVRARPVEGGADIPLAAIVPDRAVRSWIVGVGAVRGRTVRLVIDPVTSLGRRLYVRSVGPLRELLPGWDVAAGVPQALSAWGRQSIVAKDDPLSVRTPALSLPPGTRFLGMAVRGQGSVSASAGAAGARVLATTDDWTALRVPVGRSGDARLSVTATPAAGGRLALAAVGTPVRAVRITGASVTAAGIVRARASAHAVGARVEVRVRGRVAGRSTVRRGGIISVRARGSGRARLVVVADAAIIGASVPVVLPG